MIYSPSTMSRVDRTGLHRMSIHVIVRVSVSWTELGRPLGLRTISIPILKPDLCGYVVTAQKWDTIRQLWERNWKS
jgi:hypothetical protein